MAPAWCHVQSAKVVRRPLPFLEVRTPIAIAIWGIKNQPKQTEVTAAVHDHGGREGEDKSRQQHHDGCGRYGFERTVIVPSPVSAWQLSTVAGLDLLLWGTKNTECQDTVGYLSQSHRPNIVLARCQYHTEAHGNGILQGCTWGTVKT